MWLLLLLLSLMMMRLELINDHVSGNTDDYDGDVEFATDDDYGNESFETNADK